MHWALVFVLGSITFGIFYIIWIIKQLNFIKRIDPQNPSGKLIAPETVAAVVLELTGAGAAARSGEAVVID
jgi:hypothetical protein